MEALIEYLVNEPVRLQDYRKRVLRRGVFTGVALVVVFSCVTFGFGEVMQHTSMTVAGAALATGLQFVWGIFRENFRRSTLDTAINDVIEHASGVHLIKAAERLHGQNYSRRDLAVAILELAQEGPKSEVPAGPDVS